MLGDYLNQTNALAMSPLEYFAAQRDAFGQPDKYSGMKGDYPKVDYPTNAFAVTPFAADPQPPRNALNEIPERARGRAAFWGGAINALGFGIPRALTQRFLPELDAEIGRFLDERPGPATAGLLAGTVANPMNSVFRAGGDRLARAGYGVTAQGLADAGAFTGTMMAPGVVRGEGIQPELSGVTVPLAMLSRYINPTGAGGMLRKTAEGAAAGTISNITTADMIPSGASIGAMYGASMPPSRPMPRPANGGVARAISYYAPVTTTLYGPRLINSDPVPTGDYVP